VEELLGLRQLLQIPDELPITRIVSYGGNQSNAMLATAHLASEFGLDFLYVTRPPPSRFFKEQQSMESNLSQSMRLGMRLEAVEGDTSKLRAHARALAQEQAALLLPQGAGGKFAELGIRQLGEEIIAFQDAQNPMQPLTVVVPAGTGATAFFLHQHLLSRKDIEVITVPVATSPESLLLSMAQLAEQAHLSPSFPALLPSPIIRLATPQRDYRRIYCLMKRKGVEIDLLYAPKTLKAIFEHWDRFKGRRVLFVHTGGTSGNATMLQRYETAFPTEGALCPSPLSMRDAQEQ